MDRRTRELQKRWQESRDIYTHAALLIHLRRCGLLDERRILCAGFFGHKASAKALPELIKRRKVILPNRVLKTEELIDYLNGVFTWPRDVYLRAALGVSKLVAQGCISERIRNDLKIINSRFAEYICNINDDTRKALLSSTRRRYDWWRHRGASYTSRQYRIQGVISRMLGAIGNPVRMRNAIIRNGADFKDKIYRKAINDEVIPYLLGEWK